MKYDCKLLRKLILLEIAEALNEGAAGPCDYWYKRLAERLIKKADRQPEDSADCEHEYIGFINELKDNYKICVKCGNVAHC